MTIDYDAYLLEGSEEPPEIDICPMCEISFCDCEHTNEEVNEWYEKDEADDRLARQIMKTEEEDLNSEVYW